MGNDLHWQAQADQAVTNFVLAELDLVFDLIKSAKISQQSERQRQIIAIARQALSTVRHFEGRIKDTTDLKDIHDRANELEKLVCSLRDGPDKECQEPL